MFRAQILAAKLQKCLCLFSFKTKLSPTMDIKDIRAEYCGKADLFLEENIEKKEPLALFEQWFNDAKQDNRIIEPNAMALATATKEGIPSCRFVLCKAFGKDGFRFFTHYTSRKGQELEENPNAALTFFWAPFSRSVRIEGSVEKLPFSDADEYFNGRPFQSRIGALCSNQSFPIANRSVLSEKEQELKAKYNNDTVPRPPKWGGYIVKPHTIEFWQGQSDRIHDRIRFRNNPKPGEPDGIVTHNGEDGWIYERLAP